MPTTVPGLEEAVAAWVPRKVSPAAAAFARATVGAAGPVSESRRRAWLFAASRLGAFAARTGLALEPEVVLNRAVIERFLAEGTTTWSASSRRTVRSNLLSLAGALDPAPGPARLPRERAKRPYSPSEIAAYLACADAQPTQFRRLRAGGLIVLGAGAGLTGADLRGVRGGDLHWRSGGVVVEVHGRRARVVPVLARYGARLVEVADYFGARYVVGGLEANRRNVTTRLIASLSGGADLARLELGRLRATWLAEVADGLGLATFMAVAGISCSQRLGDVVAGLGLLGEGGAVALLGGRS